MYDLSILLGASLCTGVLLILVYNLLTGDMEV